MAKLDDLVRYLDEELRISEVPDYPGAHNGLQLENNGEVTKVASAVDASLPVIRKAIAEGADLLVVHHGLFWQGVRALRGPVYAKFKEAMDANLAIYSAHIPLDIHGEFGNNVLLAQALGMTGTESFFSWKGIELGRKARFSGSLGELKMALEKAVAGPVTLRGDEDDPAGLVGVITGGAGSEVEAMAKEGIDTFVTGEGPHWSHPLAEELGINVAYAGHYATETFGVRALGAILAERYRLEACDLDHPTGL